MPKLPIKVRVSSQAKRLHEKSKRRALQSKRRKALGRGESAPQKKTKTAPAPRLKKADKNARFDPKNETRVKVSKETAKIQRNKKATQAKEKKKKAAQKREKEFTPKPKLRERLKQARKGAGRAAKRAATGAVVKDKGARRKVVKEAWSGFKKGFKGKPKPATETGKRGSGKKREVSNKVKYGVAGAAVVGGGALVAAGGRRKKYEMASGSKPLKMVREEKMWRRIQQARTRQMQRRRARLKLMRLSSRAQTYALENRLDEIIMELGS